MAVEIDTAAVERSLETAKRELALTPTEYQRLLPRVLTASMRRARTLITGARGLLYQRGITARRIKTRAFTSKATRSDLTATLWLGANSIPAEHIRGNLTGLYDPPARGLTTRREGAIPRSFSIRTRGGDNLYLRRISRTRYIRITSSVLDDMDAARAAAAAEVPEIVSEEMAKQAFRARRNAARRAIR